MNQTNTSSVEEVESEDSGEALARGLRGGEEALQQQGAGCGWESPWDAESSEHRRAVLNHMHF